MSASTSETLFAGRLVQRPADVKSQGRDTRARRAAKGWTVNPRGAVVLRGRTGMLAARLLLICSVGDDLMAVEATSPPNKTGALSKANGAEAGKSGSQEEAPTYLRDVLPILMGKCARCHNDQNTLLQSWLNYNTASAHGKEMKRRVWDSWTGSYFKQPMPTANSPEAQMLTEIERRTIREWVKRGAPLGVAPAYASAQTKAERIQHGQHLFGTVCAVCHQPAGQGIAGRFPPLAGSDFLNADKRRAMKVVVNGLQGEVVVNGQRFNNSMPKFPLNDEDIANVLTYVYNSFGNCGHEVTPQEVSMVRLEEGGLAAGGARREKPVSEEKSQWE